MQKYIPPSLLRHISTTATSPYKNEQYAQDTTFALPLSSWEKEVSEGKSPFLLSPPFLAARRPSKGKARKWRKKKKRKEDSIRSGRRRRGRKEEEGPTQGRTHQSHDFLKLNYAVGNWELSLLYIMCIACQVLVQRWHRHFGTLPWCCSVRCWGHTQQGRIHCVIMRCIEKGILLALRNKKGHRFTPVSHKIGGNFAPWMSHGKE